MDRFTLRAARSSHVRRIGVAVILVMCVLAASWFGVRSYRTYVLLQSAQSLGVSEISSIRGWMTLGYISDTYQVDGAGLRDSLGLGEKTGGNLTLRNIAARRGVAVFDFVLAVQQAVARLLETRPPAGAVEEEKGFLAEINARFLSGVLTYGFPVLLAAVYFGSLGFPIPAGPVTALAGSLAAAESIAGSPAFVLAMGGSLIGDVTAYGVGRLASPAWLSRWGKWFGYTANNRKRVDALYERWGGLTIIAGMSIVSQVSSVVGLLAGLSRYGWPKFVWFALLGRLLWTAGYFGLGYVAGANFAAASGFLFNLGMLVLCVLAGAAAAYVFIRLPVRV